MSYRSFAEFMSERYHCDDRVSHHAQRQQENQQPQAARHHHRAQRARRFTIESLTGAGYKADEALSQRHAVVDTKINQVRIFEAAPAALVVAEPGATTISTATRAEPRAHRLVSHHSRQAASSSNSAPGRFATFRRAPALALRPTTARYRQAQRRLRALNIPPGPNSPVGVIWNGLSKPGIGLHGTSDPETIGRARSPAASASPTGTPSACPTSSAPAPPWKSVSSGDHRSPRNSMSSPTKTLRSSSSRRSRFSA